MFTSGMENPHRFTEVTSGKRYVLSFWFSCEEKYKFGSFLDGSARSHFAMGKNANIVSCEDYTNTCMESNECVQILNDNDFEACQDYPLCRRVLDCLTEQRRGKGASGEL